jgi:hypothetical protein
VIEHLLTHTPTLYRPSTTVDSGGGQAVTFDVVGSLRCKVNQPTPAEVQAAGVWGARLSHVVHCLPGEDVRRGDELGGDLPSDVPPDHRLRIWAVVSDSHETYRKLECETVQAEGSTDEESS